jgi:hypothetical protein
MGAVGLGLSLPFEGRLLWGIFKRKHTFTAVTVAHVRFGSPGWTAGPI